MHHRAPRSPRDLTLSPCAPLAPAGFAASTLCRPLLDGPRTTLTSLYRTHEAWLLSTPGGADWVCVSTPRAVLLPHSLVVGRLPAITPSSLTAVSVGEGLIWCDDRPVAGVRRWFAPSRVGSGDLGAHPVRSASVDAWLSTWADRLGQGAGLTPYFDDVVCGVLLGLRATADPRAEEVATELRRIDLGARTTAVSAALLRSAADGWCIPQVASLVTALRTSREVAVALARLLAVGHSSGRGLWAGLSTVLEAPVGLVAA